MNTDFPEHIADYFEVALDRLARLGGPQAALLTEGDVLLRESAAAALDDLGANEIDVRGDADSLLAGAALCRAAGSVALAYPVVEELLSVDGARLALIDAKVPRLDHGDLPGEWAAVDIDAQRYSVEIGERTTGRLGPFVTMATVVKLDGRADQRDIDLHLILGSWRILGSVERALKIACEHVVARTQFGKALSEFQAVRFAVADATVAVTALGELAKYATARCVAAPAATRSCDALVLRLHAVDTALTVLRTSHQLLGALGFCDESDISVIDRHIQPALRAPLSANDIALRLSAAIDHEHFETLFSGSQ